MAPEQAAGRKVTPATDVFALGQVAAYASTGGTGVRRGSSHGVLYRIVHEEPDLTHVPPRLMELVSRCLAKDPAARPSIAEVIALCQSANAETVLRRPEYWLPAPVSADITVRAAAPAPVQTPPPPGYGPPVAQQLTQPAQPSPVPPQPQPPYQVPHPAQGQAHANAYAPPQFPTQAQTYPGTPGAADRAAGAPAPRGLRQAACGHRHRRRAGPRRRGRRHAVLPAQERRSEVAGEQLLGRQPDERHDRQPEAERGQGHRLQAEHQAPAGARRLQGHQSAGRLPPDARGQDDVWPQKGEDGEYELSCDTGGYLDSETTGGTLVLLDPGQVVSLDVCLADTRFTETIELSTLSKGRSGRSASRRVPDTWASWRSRGSRARIRPAST